MKILVTGATGFIGRHLVRHLVASHHTVRAMVRPTSNTQALPSDLEWVYATLDDHHALQQAVDGVDAVIHLASLLKVPWKPEFHDVNVNGTRRLLEVCAHRSTPPIFIFVSSLAAAGTALDAKGRREDEIPMPVSIYGRAKRAAEAIVDDYAHCVPCSIIRPPMVFGPGDPASLPLFQSTARGIHLVPRWAPMRVSSIFVLDLCAAIEQVTLSGVRRTGRCGDGTGKGIYFAASDEVVTYAEFGHRVGAAAGRHRVRVIRLPSWISFLGACLSELWARLRDRRHVLNRDKWREATAGDWTCSAERLKTELGWHTQYSLNESLSLTAQSYAKAGVLRMRGTQERPGDA